MTGGLESTYQLSKDQNGLNKLTSFWGVFCERNCATNCGKIGAQMAEKICKKLCKKLRGKIVEKLRW